jgi:hypothetical protein
MRGIPAPWHSEGWLGAAAPGRTVPDGTLVIGSNGFGIEEVDGAAKHSM